jgi:two-component system LytT family response regulator
MIKVIIIDDEKLARNTLQAMINRYFPGRIQVIQAVESVKEGVFAIYKHNPDLVFLDIEMPGENGFKLFDYFQQVTFSVIFTTAYKNYAIEAVKVAAIDYILKPINYVDLQGAISLYEKRKVQGISKESIDKLLNAINPLPDPKGKIALPTFSGFQFERINSILYCEADQNYTHIFTTRGDSILVSKPLSYLEELLPLDSFFRIHKSYLVNMNFIKSYSRTDGFHVVLENGTVLDVANRRNVEFLKALTHREA